jgi:hypothetical protein
MMQSHPAPDDAGRAKPSSGAWARRR